MNTEYIERCEKAILGLEKLALDAWNTHNWGEHERLKGKIEGVKLAIGYYQKMERAVQHGND